METNSQVELVLATVLHHVLIGTDATSLQCLTRELLELVREQVKAQRKVVYWCLLCSQVKDSYLGVCRG